MARKRTGPAFTVELPLQLQVDFDGEHWWTSLGGRDVRLSNLDKVFWPEEGYTKGDLVAYYYNVAEWILPYLAGRPLTMKRMPNGIAGKHFFEKQAPSHAPEWMRRCAVEHEESTGGEIVNYLLVDDVAGLAFVANLGCIEFHPLHSRCGTIDSPDYCFFDLDPFEPATFADVLAVARHVKAACDALGLRAYPKISGATGMQVYVPLAPGPSYEQVRELVATVGRAIRRSDPDRVTMDWEVRKRAGRVFIDHNMNRRGANIAAVYSVRPEPGATVSTPLSWEEVEAGEVRPADFTIVTVHERLARTGDLFRGLLDDRQDVSGVLDGLGLGPPAGPVRDPQPAVVRAMQRREPKEPKPAGDGQLAEYRRKRDFDRTPEPEPWLPERPGNRFVIQKHAATRLHYDLRLERDGVLVSWAVPKGLPTRPGDKRLAVHTEDHPIDYGDFEGWIPKGEYGGGEVRIFDQGTYEALEWRDDKVTFRLHGRRHRGEYHLFKTKSDWLVTLAKASAPELPDDPPPMQPMLADAGHEPFDDPKWRFEPKLDGVRTLAYVWTDATRLVSRTGRDQTGQYPELANLAEYVNALQAVIDGEIVAVDEQGRPSFEVLQARVNLTSPRDVERVRKQVPVTLYAFDLLWLDGEDLTRLPVEERRRRLEGIVTVGGPLALTYFVDGEGRQFFAAAKRLGLEGVVAKRLGTPYTPGKRTKDWRKIKALNRQDCVILGWTPGEGSRSSSFGSLLVGAYDDGTLRWIGQAGTGFTDSMIATVLERLRGIEIPEPAVDDPDLRKAAKGARWVRPELVCEVEYLAITKSGKLRAPSFKGLRTDKLPEDCRLEPPAS